MRWLNHIPSEEELELRLKCAMMYTDISALSQCILIFLYDLQGALEDEGKLKFGNKQAVNRALDLAVSVTSHLQREIKEESSDCLRSHIKLYDELLEKLDNSVFLSGSERNLSLIDTACNMIAEKFDFLHKHHHTFLEVKDLETMPVVAKFIRCIPGERHDLEPIIRPILSGMLSQEEKKIAKEHYRQAIAEYQKWKKLEHKLTKKGEKI